jgi:hypothetical protein
VTAQVVEVVFTRDFACGELLYCTVTSGPVKYEQNFFTRLKYLNLESSRRPVVELHSYSAVIIILYQTLCVKSCVVCWLHAVSLDTQELSPTFSGDC